LLAHELSPNGMAPFLSASGPAALGLNAPAILNRLYAHHPVAVHALDINLFAGIVGPDNNRRLVIDFRYRQRDADALIVRAE